MIGARACAIVASLALTASCLEVTPVGDENTSAGGGGAGGGVPRAKTDKLDLLLVIDNSTTAEDTQALLTSLLPALLDRVGNPPCVTSAGETLVALGPRDACPTGSTRAYASMNDVHIGVLSSSLGGHGADACPSTSPTNDDHGHLLTRRGPTSPDSVPTYQGKGFLAWDPFQRLNPPGDDVLGDVVDSAQGIFFGLGHQGCDFPSQLESWYRFLVDPAPPTGFVVVNGVARSTGADNLILQERRDFIRYDAMLAIEVVSPRDDCSTREGASFFLADQLDDPNAPGQPYRMPRASSACATSPADPCCYPCTDATPQGCDPAGCSSGVRWDAQGDPTSLRCWHQKRRFGQDYLYPIDRYVAGLTSAMIASTSGEVLYNPLFVDPSGASPIRDPRLIVFQAIVGVPWQDLAADPADLSMGYATGSKAAERLSIVTGDPPSDPFMIQAIDPRSGKNPVANIDTTPPGPVMNPINGSERTIAGRDDLQYACIYPLFSSRDCASSIDPACDCKAPSNDNPLCDDAPAMTGARTLQARGKAYPGARELELVSRIGEAGVAASVCPPQIDQVTRADYGLRAAANQLADAIVARARM